MWHPDLLRLPLAVVTRGDPCQRRLMHLTSRMNGLVLPAGMGLDVVRHIGHRAIARGIIWSRLQRSSVIRSPTGLRS